MVFELPSASVGYYIQFSHHYGYVLHVKTYSHIHMMNGSFNNEKNANFLLLSMQCFYNFVCSPGSVRKYFVFNMNVCTLCFFLY